jgi:microcystin-dependent protein
MTDHLESLNTFYGETSFPTGSTVRLSPDVVQVGTGSTVGTDVWNVLDGVVRVSNVVARDAYLSYATSKWGGAWADRPIVVWRADGAFGGLLEAYVAFVGWIPLTASAGTIELCATSTAPAGWALCQGQVIGSNVDYPALWANIDAAWREGSNIRLPDLRARTAVGSGKVGGTTGTQRNLGNTGGAESVQLAPSQTPLKNHSHTTPSWDNRIKQWLQAARLNIFSDWGGGVAGGGINYLASSRTGNESPYSLPINGTATPAAAAPTLETSETGDGSATPHENMPPFVTLNYKIKL